VKSLTEMLTAERPVLGTWSQLGSPEAIDILGAAGFDFTIIDAEHGSFGMEAVENLVRACDAAAIVPLVRVPSADPMHITRALDAGAAAVVVPGIRSVEEAAAAIACGRFAPEGVRGACPCVRAGGHWVEDWRGYAASCERETGIVALAETTGALDDVGAICELPGLRALMIGPFDLSVALGLQGDTHHPQLVGAIRRMLGAARKRSVPAILPVFAPDLIEARKQVESWHSEGVRHFTLGTDKILLHSQSARFVTGLRGTLGEAPETP